MIGTRRFFPLSTIFHSNNRNSCSDTVETSNISDTENSVILQDRLYLTRTMNKYNVHCTLSAT